MKVTLSVNEQGTGCVAALQGCGVGGHVARFVFLEPYYGPVEVRFDGGHGEAVRDGVLHQEVIATVVDSDDFWDQRAKLEPYKSPPKSAKAVAKAAAKDEDPEKAKPTKDDDEKPSVKDGGE